MKNFEYKKHTISYGKGLQIDEKVGSYENLLKELNSQINWTYIMWRRTNDEEHCSSQWLSIGHAADNDWYCHKGSLKCSCPGKEWLYFINTQEDAIEFLKHMENIFLIGNEEQSMEYIIKEKQNMSDNDNKIIDNWIETMERH